ncbi:MAG TPA: ATP-binding protein [Bryobacteraceae bacterium]|nr:ATP-binding protein [Bryobacteraceae bacterium]
MTGNADHTTAERLDLQSRISDLARIPPWIERLASTYSIPDSTQFAMNLCLEEALSNVIRHGYRGTPGSIAILFSTRNGQFVFVVEDEAPLFNPVNSPELPAMNSLEEAQIGGQGIRLLRQFSDALEYHATPRGNRLTIGFASARSVTANI